MKKREEGVIHHALSENTLPISFLSYFTHQLFNEIIHLFKTSHVATTSACSSASTRHLWMKKTKKEVSLVWITSIVPVDMKLKQ